jgi:hypothetical protein
VGATVCGVLLLAVSTHTAPPLGAVLGWIAALLVELAVLSAWLSLAATWLGRLPALGVSILVVGRAHRMVGAPGPSSTQRLSHPGFPP